MHAPSVTTLSEVRAALRWMPQGFSSRLGIFLLVCSVSLLSGYVISVAREWALSAVLASVVLVLLAMGRRVLAPAVLSPTRTFAVTYVAMGLLGGLLFPVVEGTGGVSILLTPTGAPVEPTSHLFLGAALVASSAAIVSAALTASVSAPKRPHKSLDTTPEPTFFDRQPSRAVVLSLIGLSVSAAVFTLIGQGIDGVLDREVYLPEEPNQRELAGAGKVLVVPSIIASAYVARATTSRFYRTFAVSLILIHTIVLFELATRRLAAIPILVALGWIVARPSRNRSGRTLVVALIASLLLLQLPLVLRSQESHGLIPYAKVLVGQGSGASRSPASALGNVTITFPITQQIAFHAPPLPIKDFWQSVNPLPGSLIGWYDTEPNHRLNATTPYSATGELANYGSGLFISYFLVAGGVLGYADRRIRALMADGRHLWALALLATGLLFTVVSLQYNTRTGTRLLYYLLAVDLLARIAVHFRGRSLHGLHRASGSFEEKS